MKDLIIFQKMYDFILWIYPTIKKFPKSEQYVLGQRIEQTCLNILEHIIASVTTKQSVGELAKADIELEKLRIFIRLSKDLQCMDFKKYEHASKQVVEIGKLLGGMLKSSTFVSNKL